MANETPIQLRKVLQEHLSGLLTDIRGQGIVEYVLMVALMAFAAVAAERTFACHIECGFAYVVNQLEHILANGKKIPPGQAKKCSKKCD